MNVPLNSQDLETLKQWLGRGSINIFGRPFSGKDTQGNRLAAWFDAPLIGGGDILRSSDNENVKSVIDAGRLAPQSDFISMIVPYLSKPEFANRPLVLSSIGRWIGEEGPIMKAVADAGHPLKAVITLTIPEDTVHERWEANRHNTTRGDRKDDDAEHINTRLQEYRDKTIPVIQHFRSRNMLVEVDGTKSPDDVSRDILGQLLDLAQGSSTM